MKKKIILSIISVFAFGLFVGNVCAADTLKPITAKIPSVIPEVNDTVYTAADSTTFDVSNLVFTTATGTILFKGDSAMRKIVMTSNPVSDGSTLATAIGEAYFTAYCLDNSLKYPEYNTLTFNGFNGLTDEKKVEQVIIFTLYNNKALYDVFKGVVGYQFGTTPVDYTSTYADAAAIMTALTTGDKKATVKVTALHYVSLTAETKDITAKDLAGNDTATEFEVTLSLDNVKFTNYSATAVGTQNYDKQLWILEHSYPTLTLEETFKQAGTSLVNVMAELAAFDEATKSSTATALYGAKYNEAINAGKLETEAKAYAQKAVLEAIVSGFNAEETDALGNKTTKLANAKSSLDYINQCATETLTLPTALVYPKIAAGLNQKLSGNTALQGYLGVTSYNEKGTDINPTVCQKVVNYYKTATSQSVEDYTYATVQYALWKVNGNHEAAGILGLTEFNTLYQYLIKDRSETNGYSSLNYSNTVDLNKPESGKEIYKDNKDNYIYGPYTITGDVLTADSFTLSVVGGTKGVSFVDKDGNAITKVGLGEKFYVKCSKSEKVANVSIKVGGTLKTFYPNENRARVYYSFNPTMQNVITGGKLVSTNVDQQFDLVYNPKTGVTNLAIIFVISLIAFSLGYLALNYKNQEINLD